MKLGRLFCVIIVLLVCAAQHSEAGGPGWRGGGGWYGGGGWRGGYGYGGGGGVVIVSPGYFYPPYPYYSGPYYGYAPSQAYYNDETNGASLATAVQQQLASRGYYKGPIDGVVGAGTRAAISSFQRRHGLEVSGTIDTPLLRSLGL